LILQQQTHTRRTSIRTSDQEGSVSILGLQIGIDVGMGKEDGDNQDMAFDAGGVKGGSGILPSFFQLTFREGFFLRISFTSSTLPLSAAS